MERYKARIDTLYDESEEEMIGVVPTKSTGSVQLTIADRSVAASACIVGAAAS
jgi:hypothetical protein